MSETQRLVVGVPTETKECETRVAIFPGSVSKLGKMGCDVHVQRDAGDLAGFLPDSYTDAGATVTDRDAILSGSDVLVGVNLPWVGGDCSVLKEQQIIVGCCDPLWEPEKFKAVAERNVTCFALELLPRITRAQSMDILSSMATCAGYKAVLLAAQHSNRLFPMLMTAAGTVKPARVLVIGAGVAGLQAIATAKRLGAVVSAYDVRPAVKEQVESLGGKFIELELKTQDSESKGGYAKEMDEDFYKR
ncbi:MAG: NAD(P)(+) transhydrogenase (Re/Si-specific) subunit alpha, partial [Planctomycetaceae bacterium]